MEDGLYDITIKSKQNRSNSRVFRRLYVNGIVPFAEANNLALNIVVDGKTIH